MKSGRGFTLIELMIVVAIIGILAAVAIPRFAEQIDKSKEGATKGSLAALRSALNIYYAGHEGKYPVSDSVLGSLGCLLDNPLYLGVMPVAKLPQTGVPDSSAVKAVAADGLTQPDNSGGWFYYDDPANTSAWGTVVVNCTEEDMKSHALTLAGAPGHTYTAWSTF